MARHPGITAIQGDIVIVGPAISTGVYGFPRRRACAIAVEEMHRFLLTNDSPTGVVLVAFDPETAGRCAGALASG